MNRTVLSFVLLALLGIALCDEMLSREKRQDRRYNRPGYGGGFNNNNYNRPSNNYNRPTYGNNRPFNNNFNNNNYNRPNNNFNYNRPNNNYNNNRPGGGLTFTSQFGQPGAPIQQQKPPHSPAVGALFGALLNAHTNNNNNNQYGRPTVGPTFVINPHGPFGRPEYGYFSEDVSIHVRNKDKITQGKVAV